MKNELAVLAAVLLAGPFAVAQNIEGQIIASQYGEWKVQGYSPDTYTFAPTACRVQGGASFFPAFAVGTPIRIVDGSPKLSETVIPSSFLYNNTTCSISVSPVNHHQLPYYLTSATGGLQEAINANSTNPATNTIILNNAWYQLGGSGTIISSVQGTYQLGLVDVTTIPANYYRWNGTRYVLVPIDGGHNTGDYTCDMVTNCWSYPGQGFYGNLSTSMTSSQTTLATSVFGNPGTEGYLFVDSEWMHYTKFVAGPSNTGTFTLGPDLFGCTTGRGCFGDSPVGHGTFAQVQGAIFVGAYSNQPAGISVTGSGTVLAIGIGNPHPTGNAVWLGNAGDYISYGDGGYHQSANGLNGFTGQVYIGTSAAGGGPFFGFYPLLNSTNIPQANVPSEMQSQEGFGSGIAGNVEAVAPATIPAATLTPTFMPSGPCSITYDITGIDQDGNTVAGTNVTATGLEPFPWTFPTDIGIQGQKTAGVVSYRAYRVATSGCGTATLGQWTAAVTGTDYPNFQDGGAAADGSTPPESTTSVPKLCTNGTQFCILSGTTSTPPVACAAGTAGWEFHNVSATANPHVYICQSSTWTGVY